MAAIPIAIGVLLALHAIVFAAKYGWHLERPRLTSFADLDGENNPAMWFSSIQLAFAALLGGIWAHTRRWMGDRDSRYWTALAVLLVFLSLDEAASLHEALSFPMSKIVRAEGFFHWAWVIPAIAFVAITAAVCTRFLLRLTPALRNGLILAAVVYFGSAVGIEMLTGKITEIYSSDSLLYHATVIIEEGGEMLGVWLLMRFYVRQFTALEMTARFAEPLNYLQPKAVSITRTHERPVEVQKSAEPRRIQISNSRST